MTIPLTYSAPADATFEAMLGFAPSIEDCLRAAVWLMLYSDTVNRAAYSFDSNDATKGVRIRQTQPEQDPETGRIVLPQQLVGVVVSSSKFEYKMSGAGEKTIAIDVIHLGAFGSDWVPDDVAAPSLTAEARLARMSEILMRGTLWREAVEGEQWRHVVVDPYYSGLDVDGHYDPAKLVILTTKPPDIRPLNRRVYANPRKTPRTESDFLQLDPIRDFAVAYGVRAVYSIDVSNRENMRRGG